MTDTQKNGRLSFMTKLSYGVGDIYGGGVNTLISMYYLFFLTDVIQIGPALAGTTILASRLFGAVLDPVMGAVSDNTKTRWGRRRPYFLAGVPLIFLSFVLMWIPVGYQREGMRFLYVLMVNLFFTVVYSFVWVPYNSIAADLTSDYDERTKLAAWRMVFSNIAGMLAAMLSRDFFVTALYPAEPQKGFFLMAVAFGLFFSLPYVLTFLFCKETSSVAAIPVFKWGGLASLARTHVAEPFRIRPFSALLLMFLFGFMAQDAVMVLAVYFMTCYLKTTSMMTLLIPMYVSVFLVMPVAEVASKRLGKKGAFLAAGALWFLAFGLIPFMNPGATAMVCAFGFLFGAAVGGIQVMLFAMIPDVPDADELFSHRRREGLLFGMLAMSRKTGGALVIFLIGCGIQLAGYLPPVGNAPQQQSAVFLAALFAMFAVIPLLFMLIAMIACFRYPLTGACHERLKRVLAARSAGHPLTDEEQREESELRGLLGHGR